jgi:hypothetical protein
LPGKSNRAGPVEGKSVMMTGVITTLEHWSDLDFGFWNLDFRLKLLYVDAQSFSGSVNPKSEI